VEVGTFLLIPSIICGVLIFATAQDKEGTTQPGTSALTKDHVTATIGIAYSKDQSILDDLWSMEPNCVAAGIHCLAEEKTKDKIISIPIPANVRTVRIAILVMSNDGMEEPHIAASTSNPAVSLNHVDQDDGTIHNQVDFTPTEITAMSHSGYPNASLIDIKFPRSLVVIPLTLSVGGSNWDGHTIKTSISLLR